MENLNIVENLREELKKRVVKFSYYKENGELRNAVGTRNFAVAEKSGVSIPALKGGYENPNAYYDFEKEGWRSFIPENVICMEDE